MLLAVVVPVVQVGDGGGAETWNVTEIATWMDKIDALQGVVWRYAGWCAVRCGVPEDGRSSGEVGNKQTNKYPTTASIQHENPTRIVHRYQVMLSLSHE
ncbi:hypothetical protein EX30DRAFT_226201 [Ascodesmis nigricans]|uniref:Uncharacterized protein n=1 Tax=Ascodesmis nigricans TaxID=341454 RepID=A0A4S2MJ70_9PEZI|nr:hypothetical protein EX30DRAFT_226201 [Ascodesmis nigricans]